MVEASGTVGHRGGVARLALADGSVFSGEAFGAVGRGGVRTAEVVFGTSMTGYQESLTDPSYTGQILVQTATQIGNTGVNARDVESSRVSVSGFVVRELSDRVSSFRAEGSLEAYLAEAGVLGITGVDTRALTRLLRSEGSMNGALTDDASVTDAELVDAARRAQSMDGANYVDGLEGRDHGLWRDDSGAWRSVEVGNTDEPALRVLALDCGVKRNILRLLTDRGCAVEVAPWDISADELLAKFESGGFDGLFVSNGPGDPEAVEATVASLRSVLASELPPPTFGICLGHQLLSLAIGAKTYKLKFGHRGANQPVRDERTGRVEITSQNHGFAVEAESLAAAGGQVTHTHLNDQTIAGFRLKDRPVFSVQYHPEASPGPHDAGYLFDEFVESMRARRMAGTR
ncbi:MAG: glutamine-hydrolyzing carbamoyl-phosphate synthase small subunit [Planctomycetota bacterium]